jgi:hypothetical protein
LKWLILLPFDGWYQQLMDHAELRGDLALEACHYD